MEYQLHLEFNDGTVRTIRSFDVKTLAFVWHTFRSRWAIVDGPVLTGGSWSYRRTDVDQRRDDLWRPLDVTNIV
jgi:hypothetical protein